MYVIWKKKNKYPPTDEIEMNVYENVGSIWLNKTTPKSKYTRKCSHIHIEVSKRFRITQIGLKNKNFFFVESQLEMRISFETKNLHWCIPSQCHTSSFHLVIKKMHQKIKWFRIWYQHFIVNIKSRHLFIGPNVKADVHFVAIRAKMKSLWLQR